MHEITFANGTIVYEIDSILAIAPHAGANGPGTALYTVGGVIIVTETPAQVQALLSAPADDDQADTDQADTDQPQTGTSTD